MNQSHKEEIINKERRILATYDETTIRIYQAYNNRIADEALKLGRFGDSFKMDRIGKRNEDANYNARWQRNDK